MQLNRYRSTLGDDDIKTKFIWAEISPNDSKVTFYQTTYGMRAC